MNEEQLTIAANSVCGLMDATGSSLEDVLDALMYHDVITSKQKEDIIERIESV